MGKGPSLQEMVLGRCESAYRQPGVAADTCNPGTLQRLHWQSWKRGVSLDYIESSRVAWATERDPLSKTQVL